MVTVAVAGDGELKVHVAALFVALERCRVAARP